MHLRRNKYQEQHPPKPVAIEGFNWDSPALSKELCELAKMRKVLHKKMTEIENRLRFGYSQPLYDYKMQLVKEDLELCCKMTDVLVALPSA